MAVGGMIGGGIFSVLGVVVEQSREYAAISFLIGGLIALITADSYVRLALHFREGGGSFTYLMDLGYEGLAGSLSWVLTVGYVLTMSVYAFTFGHYLGEVAGLNSLLVRLAAVGVIAVFVGVNLRGVASSGLAEELTVWGKVTILVGLAIIGLLAWHPGRLNDGVSAPGVSGVIVGAAAVFMAYEGFELVTFDYDDMKDPQRMLGRAIIPAVICVTAIYIVVAVGTAFLVGAGTLVENKEVALAIAGQEAAGTPGKIVVSVAALLSTGSAINATLFATARLSKRVAEKHEAPKVFLKTVNEDTPVVGVVGLGAGAAVLAAIGGLGALVDSASLIFLIAFAIVNAVAAREMARRRLLAILGAVAAVTAVTVLAASEITDNPLRLLILVAIVGLAVAARPVLLALDNRSSLR